MSDALDPDRLADFADAIGRELDELHALSGDTAADRAPVPLDQQSVGRLSRMDALQGSALAQASERRRHARRLALELAQRRLETGEFGFCLDCGEPIALRRLEIDPAATLCIACAQRSQTS